MEKYQDSAGVIVNAIKNYKELADGSLLLWGRVARTGEYDYGTHKQVINKDALFEAESLDTLVGLPVTLSHPPTFIETVEDRNKYSIGVSLQEIVKEEGTTDSTDDTYLTIATLIWDKPSIEGIKNKTINQFSPGYYAEKTQDESGKIIQSARRYNHIALTPSGRGGENVRALVDSAETIQNIVELHAQYRDSLIDAGITPSYKWTSLELKRNIVGVLTGKSASNLDESTCDALMQFLPAQASKPVIIAGNSSNNDSDPHKRAEKLYIERLESAYIRK